MDYYLIKGSFHVVRYAPDGDSLMFEAENPKDWENLQSQYQELFQKKLEEGAGSVQLRLQGIDALETHYRPGNVPTPFEMRGKKYGKAERPKARNIHQPVGYGDMATEKLLSYLGVEEIKWRSGFGRKWISKITVSVNGKTHSYSQKGADRIPGYVVSNDIDRKGRPIVWVFPGSTSTRSGTHLSEAQLLAQLKQSSNYRLLATGLVYPYFFMTLSAALRQPLIHGVQNAQRQKMNLWQDDQTQDGIRIRRFSELTEHHLIFPYIFRRMVKHQFKRQMEGYWEAVGKKNAYQPDIDNLFLESFFDDTNPYVFKVDERDFVRLDNVLTVTKTQLKLNTHPGNIVFLS